MAVPLVVIRRLLTASSLGWAIAIFSATWMAALARPSVPAYAFSLLVYAAGSVVCHQLPERSYVLWGRQLPVCARCTGIYVGAAMALVILAVRRFAPAAPRSTRTRLWLLASAVALNAGTLAYEWTSGVAPANGIRAAAGFALGAVVAWFLIYDVD